MPTPSMLCTLTKYQLQLYTRCLEVEAFMKKNQTRGSTQKGPTKCHQLKFRPQELKMNGGNASEPFHPKPDVEVYPQSTKKSLRNVLMFSSSCSFSGHNTLPASFGARSKSSKRQKFLSRPEKDTCGNPRMSLA